MAHWEPSKDYKDYVRTMKEGNMSSAYRCSKCGQFRDGYGVHVQWDVGDDSRWPSIDLCPDCAPAVLAPLAAIAVTKHEAPEMILARGEVRIGDEHTDADDALWTSESDG